ncbi:MAG: hypothetical protein CMJ54_07585 [Planctomycetaceae bacterium]|nr:hypothetical protein [Planctomycetaceae bacterium]
MAASLRRPRRRQTTRAFLFGVAHQKNEDAAIRGVLVGWSSSGWRAVVRFGLQASEAGRI